MELKTYLLAQLDREAAQTRKTIARVADPQSPFKPHERSTALNYLAALVATMPGWIALMIDRDELNLDDPSADGFRTKVQATQADLLSAHDAAVADARRALARFSLGHVGYIAGIGIAFVSAPATLVISAVVAAYYVFEQTPARSSQPAGGESAASE